MAIGELILGFLALDALGSKRSAAAPPPPPPVPDAGGGGGDTTKDLASAAGTAAASLIGLIGGGGSAAGGSVSTTGTLAITGGVTGGIGGGTTTAETTAVAAAEGTVIGAVSAGEIFAAAWGAFVVIQFIVINLVNNARVGWLRYRNRVLDLNLRPYAHLHHLEQLLVQQALGGLGLNWQQRDADDSSLEGSRRIPDGGPGTDPRLNATSLSAENGQDVAFTYYEHRQLYGNPFPLGSTRSSNWRLLQQAARLVAARYVFELGAFARGMLSSFPNLGGHLTTEWGATPLEVWAYPLLGGGVPDKTYAAMADELRALGPSRDGTTIDDILNAARLAAVLHAAAAVQLDPSIYFPWNPATYSSWLYSAMGLSVEKHRIALYGQNWLIDPAFYKVPAKQLFLDIDALKAGLPMQPFLNAGTPTDFSLTSLKARV